jgi:hypothetical protein
LAVPAPVQEATAAFHNATGAWWADPCLAPCMAKLLWQASTQQTGSQPLVTSPWPWAVDNQWQCVPNNALAPFDRVMFLASGALLAAPLVDGSLVGSPDGGEQKAGLDLQLKLLAPCLAYVPRHWTLTNDPAKTHAVHLCARVHEP